MVFRIYCGENFTVNREYTMFDIEYYLFRNKNNLWQSELHVLPIVEGLVRYTLSQKDNSNFNVEQFIADSKIIQELRGWLWEVDGNKPDDKNKLHYGERYQYISTLLDEYAKKYGCYISVD